MTALESVTVLSHARPEETGPALHTLVRVARERSVTVRLDRDETRKYDVARGDGTILRALRRYAGTGVPVFAVNYGRVGFLATVDPGEDLAHAFELALSGRFETLSLPAIEAQTAEGPTRAINDLAIHRRISERVAELGYSINGEEAGSVRSDGLVLATPAGSTGYNLANGGPVMAWGVEGFAVSFIAPHSLTARALVVAPDDEVTVHNRSGGSVDVTLDGRPAGELGPGHSISACYRRDVAKLAQVPGSSFYRRLRDKFGRLAA